MRINIKNEQIRWAVAFEKDNKTARMSVIDSEKKLENLSDTERALIILIGYLDSLLEVTRFPEVRVRLDLSYDTISNLPVAVGNEFAVGISAGYTVEQNIEVVEKTIAAYLMLLAANEHDAVISARKAEKFENASEPLTYAGLIISIEKERMKINLLESIHGYVQYIENKAISISFDRVLEAYKNLTDIDLKINGN